MFILGVLVLLTLQLTIQTQNSMVPELQVFVTSLKISAIRAHPRGQTPQNLKLKIFQSNFSKTSTHVQNIFVVM